MESGLKMFNGIIRLELLKVKMLRLSSILCSILGVSRVVNNRQMERGVKCRHNRCLEEIAFHFICKV